MRDVQTVRVARKVADEPNSYDEEVQKVVGIFAPHLGADHVFETRTTEWRIVRKAVDVEPLTLKSASGAPRSPVNNCGEVDSNVVTDQLDGEPVEDAAVLEHPPETQIDWDDMAVVRSVMTRLRVNTHQIYRQYRGVDLDCIAESASLVSLTIAEKA